MKNIIACALILTALAGCKKQEKVDNAATRYTSGLQQDVVKAQDAALKANQAVAEQNARMQEAEAAAR